MPTPVDTPVTNTPVAAQNVPAPTPAATQSPAADPRSFTNNPTLKQVASAALAQQYADQPLSASEQQLASDWANLTVENFTAKYGPEATHAMALQSAAQDQNIMDAAIADSKTGWESVGDATKNFIGGGLSAITGTLAGATSSVRPVSKAFAYLTEGIDSAMQNLASEAELAEQRMYARRLEAINRRLDREEAEDVAKGASTTEAGFARMGKEFMASLGAGFDTGHWSQVVGQGLGSTAASIGLTGGIGGIAAKAGLAAKFGATKAGQLLAKATPSWLGKAAPWSLSEMAMEGGGQYSQQLLEGLKTDFDTLEKNSPEFRRLYKAYKDQGLDDANAKERAREDVAFASARESGALTALATAPLAVLSSGIAKPFTSAGRPFRSVLGDSLAEMFVSEPGQEASGQFFGNLATQRYLNQNQKLNEGVGQAAAEGFQGAMGMSGIHVGTAGLVPGAKAAATGIGKAVNAATGGVVDKLKDKFGSNGEEDTEDSGSDETGEKTLQGTAINGLSTDTVKYWSAGIRMGIDNSDSLSETQKKEYKDKLSEVLGRHVVDKDVDLSSLSPELRKKLEDTDEEVTDEKGNTQKVGNLGKYFSTLMDVVEDEKADAKDRDASAETVLRLAQKFALSPEDVQHLDAIADAVSNGKDGKTFSAAVRKYKENLQKVAEAFQKPVIRQRIQKAASHYLAANGGPEGLLNKTIANINGSLNDSDKFVEKTGSRKFAPSDINAHQIRVTRAFKDADGTLDITAQIDNDSATINVPNGSTNSEIYQKLIEANDKLKGKLRLEDIPEAKKTVAGSGTGSPRDTLRTVLFAMNNASESGINGKNFDNISKQLQQIASAPNGSHVSTRDKHLAAMLFTKLNVMREAMEALPEAQKGTGIEQVAKNIFTNKAEDPADEAPRIKGKSFYEHLQDFEAAYSVGDLDAAVKSWNRVVRLASHLKNKAMAQDAAYNSIAFKEVKDKKTGQTKRVTNPLNEGYTSGKHAYVGIAMDNGAAITSNTTFKHTVKGREYTQALIKQAKIAQDLVLNMSALKGVMKTLEAGASKGNVLYKKGVKLQGEEAKLVTIFDPITYSDSFKAYMEAAPQPKGGGLGLKLKETKFNSPLTEAEESLVYTDYSKFTKEQREKAFKNAFEFEESTKEKVSEDILKDRLDISRYEFLHQFDDYKASLGNDKTMRGKLERLIQDKQAFSAELEKRAPSLARYLKNAPDSTYQKITQFLLNDSFEDKFGKTFDSLIAKALTDVDSATDVVYKENKIGLVGLSDDAKALSPIVKEVFTFATKQALLSASNRQTISDNDRVFENWRVDLSKYFAKGKKDPKYMAQYNALRQGTDIVNFVNSIISNVERYTNMKYSQDIPVHFTKGVTASLAYAAVRALADAGYINITNVELINKAENKHRFEEDSPHVTEKGKKKLKSEKDHNAHVDMVWFNKEQKTLGDNAKKLNIQDIYDILYGKDYDPELEVAFTDEFRKQYNAGLQQNNPPQPQPIQDWFDLNGLENKPENAATSSRDKTAKEMRQKGITETLVGGTTRGSKYPEGIYTLPGTHPDTWNGQKLSDIRDPEGGRILGKFYSETGSEYIYSENGYSRRVKFWDSDTNGKDAGVADWQRIFFFPAAKSTPAAVPGQKPVSGINANNITYYAFVAEGKSFLSRVKQLSLDKNGKLMAIFKDSYTDSDGTWDNPKNLTDGQWHYVTYGIFQPGLLYADNNPNEIITFPLNSKPGLNTVAIELPVDKTFKEFHLSSGPHYFETGSQQSGSQPAPKSKEPLKQADMVSWAEKGGQTLYKIHSSDPFDKIQYEVLKNRVKKEFKYNWGTITKFLNNLKKNPDGTFARDDEGNLDVTDIAAMFGIFQDPADNKMLRESKEGRILPIREAMETILANMEASINLLASEGFIPADTTVYDVLKSPDLQAQLSKTACHFNTSFANTNREQQLHGVNPLGNKYYRECLINTGSVYDLTPNTVTKDVETWEDIKKRVADPKNPGKTKLEPTGEKKKKVVQKTVETNENLLYFKAAMLQGIFGEKIQDYPSVQAAAEEWDDIVADGKTGNFNKTIRAYFSKDTHTFAENKEFYRYLTEDCGIKPIDITPVLYHNLEQWIRYEDAVQNGGMNPFTGDDITKWNCDVYLDLDGQCNGSAMKQMYEANGIFDVDAIKYMNAVGFALGNMRTAADLRQDDAYKTEGPSAKVHKGRKKNIQRAYKTNVDTYTNGGKDGLESFVGDLKQLKENRVNSDAAANEFDFWNLVYETILRPQITAKDADGKKYNPSFDEVASISDNGRDLSNYSLMRAWLKKQIQAEKYNGSEQAIAGRIVSLYKDDLAQKLSDYNRAFLNIKRNQIFEHNRQIVAGTKTGKKYNLARNLNASNKLALWGSVIPGTQSSPAATITLGEHDLQAIAFYCVNNGVEPADYLSIVDQYCDGTPDFYNHVKGSYIRFGATLQLLSEKSIDFRDEGEKNSGFDRILGVLESLDSNIDAKNGGFLKTPILQHKDRQKYVKTKSKDKKYPKKSYRTDFKFKFESFENFEFTSEQEENLKNNLANSVGGSLYKGYTKSSRHSRQTTDFKLGTSTVFAYLKKQYIHWRANQLAREAKAVFTKDGYPKFGYTPAQLKQAKKEADKLFPAAKIGYGDSALHVGFFNTTEKVKNGGLPIQNLVSKSGNANNTIYLGERDIAMPGVSFDPRSVFAFGDTGSFANWIMYPDSLPIYDGSTAPPNNIRNLSEFAAKTINNKVLTPELGTAFWLADAWEKNFAAMQKVDPEFFRYLSNRVNALIKDRDELRSSNLTKDGEINTDLNDLFELNRALRTLQAAIQGKTVDEMTAPISDKTFLLDTFGDANSSPFSINPATENENGEKRPNLWTQTLDALKELKLQRIAHVRAIKRYGLSSEHIAGAHRPIFTIEDENGKTHDYTLDDVPDQYRNIPAGAVEIDPANKKNKTQLFRTPEQQAEDLNKLYQEEMAKLKDPLSSAVREESEITLNKDNLDVIAHWFRTNATNRSINDVRLFNTVKTLLSGTDANGTKVLPLLSNAKIKFYHDKNRMKSDYYLTHSDSSVMSDLVEAFYDVTEHTIYISLPKPVEKSGFLDDRAKMLLVHEMIHAATTRALFMHKMGLSTPELDSAIQQLQISMATFLSIFSDDLLKYTGIANSLKGKKNLTAADKAALKMHKELLAAQKKVDIIQDCLAKGNTHEALGEYMAYAMTTPVIWKLLRQQSKGAIYASINQMYKNTPNEAKRLTSFLDKVTVNIKKALEHIGRLLGISAPRAQWVAEYAELGLPKKADDSFSNAELLETAMYGIANFNEAKFTFKGRDLGWGVDGILFSLDQDSSDISSPAAQNFVGNFVSKVLPKVDISNVPTEDMDSIADATSLAGASFNLSNVDVDTMNLAAACIKNGKGFSSNQYIQLTRIYLNAQQNLKADMFDSMGDDKLKALFNPDLPADIKVPVFCAIAMTSPEVQNALRKVPKTKYAKATGGVALDRFLMDSGNILIDKLQRSLSGTRGENANAELNSTVNFAAKHMDAKEQARKRGAFIKALNAANDAIIQGVGAFLDKVAPNTKGIRQAGYITIHELLNRVNAPEWLRRLILDIIPSDTRKAAATIYNMLSSAKTEIDQLRQRTLEIMPQALKDLFKNKLTQEQDQALHNTIIRTDLAGVFTFDQAAKYIKSPEKRKARLTQIKQQLSLANWKWDHADYLAEYLATGKYPAEAFKAPVMFFNAFHLYYAGKNALTQEIKNYNKLMESGKEFHNKDINLLDEYISLKALDQTDNTEVIKLLETDEEGVKGIFEAQKKALDMEFETHKNDITWGNRMNAVKGYTPMTQNSEGSLIWSVEDLHDQGYIRTKENKNIWYAPFGANSKFNEGIVRHTQQTYRGASTSMGTSRNGFGFISNNNPSELDKTKTALKNQGIPYRSVFSKNGKYLGIEVILPADILEKYLRPNFEATTQVAKYYGRILEENKAGELSFKAIDILYDMFLNAGGANVNRREYVNLFELAKTDKIVAEALDMLPQKYKRYIASKFGGTPENPQFWVPRNQIYECIGVREFSVVDIFTGKTNISPQTQKRLQNIAHWIMGKKAAYYLKYGEALIQRGVNLAKNTILVRSISVGEGNIVSNFLQCLSYGMTLPQIFKAYRRVQAEVESYIKNVLEIQKCEAQKLAYAKNSPRWNALQNTIDSLTAANEKLDIKELIDWGHLNTIEDMGIAPDDLKLLSGKWAEYHEAWVEKAPESLQTVEKYALITRNSAGYVALNKMLIYGDFIAKQILKEHLEQEGKMSKEEIQNEVRDAFVDYNRSAGRVRQYLENMGLLWFWNYKLRMVRIMAKLAAKNPLFLLLATAAPAYMGINSLMTDNFVGNLFNGKLAASIGPGMFFHSFSMNPWISNT